jgi:Nucleoside H+ symporter
MTADAPASGHRPKLCLLMFLTLFVWGAWFELGFDYIPKLGFGPWEEWLVYAAFNVAALFALFFGTQFADRNFAAEKFLAFSHLVGGAAMVGLYLLPGTVGTEPGQFVTVKLESKGAVPDSGSGTLKLTKSEDAAVVVTGVEFDWAAVEADATKKPTVTARVTEAKEVGGKTFIQAEAAPIAPFVPFFLCMLVHSLFYVPTISIANSIAFANLRNPATEFGPVRVWGTVGWIAASWPFIFILVDWAQVPAFGTVGFVEWMGKALGTSVQGAAAMELKKSIFLVSGIASFVLAGYSLLLPHTPPKPAGGGDSLAWLKAMRLLKHPFVAVLFLVTFIDAAVHQSFFFWTFTFLGPTADGGVVDIPANWVGPVMKIGQIAEILTMLVLGYVLKSLGWRLTMTLGVLGHGVRFAVFAYFPEQVPAVAVNVIHGVCYAFFFATVYIFVDEYFPKDVRSSAQGLFNALILGVGPMVASFACGRLKTANQIRTVIDGKEMTVTDFPAVFQYSLAASVVGAVLLFAFFHPPSKRDMET